MEKMSLRKVFIKGGLILVINMLSFQGFASTPKIGEFPTSVNSTGELKQEVLKYEIEYISLDNVELVSVKTYNLKDKVNYLILDSRGTVLGGGIITKSLTKIALKDFPKGTYSIKLIGKNFASINKIII